jgi:hypothetical protein
MQPRFLLPPLFLVCAGVLSGCESLLTATAADVAGIAGAGIAGAVTKSPAGAAAIGLGVAAGANAGLQYVERDVHMAEQDQIAQAAGALDPDVVGHWSISHTIPIEADEHGDVVVTRLVGTSDFNCKEIIFSVNADKKSDVDKKTNTVKDSDSNTVKDSDTDKKPTPQRAFYTATICQDGQTWKWASAEPATARWGSLQ